MTTHLPIYTGSVPVQKSVSTSSHPKAKGQASAGIQHDDQKEIFNSRADAGWGDKCCPNDA